MSSLRSAVYVAKPIRSAILDWEGKPQHWSPISCTLVYSEEEAVLIDTPITIEQTTTLAQWIKDIAPGRKLSYVFITHGHGDHFFGLPVLVEQFPETVPVATAGTAKQMETQVSKAVYEKLWAPRFGDQIAKPFRLASPLPESNEFRFGDGTVFQAIECGQSDTSDSSVLWVPDLRLAVCGDVVYGWVHQMLLETNTQAKREEWIRAIEKVEALNPLHVVAGHKIPEEMDGVWHLAATKKYIEDFGRVMQEGLETPEQVFDEMKRLYPTRLNDAPLRLSCMGAFQGSR